MTRPLTEETTETSGEGEDEGEGEGEGEGSSSGELGEDDDADTAPDPVAVEETATEWSAWHLDIKWEQLGLRNGTSIQCGEGGPRLGRDEIT